jgi:hypothetical protein
VSQSEGTKERMNGWSAQSDTSKERTQYRVN